MANLALLNVLEVSCAIVVSAYITHHKLNKLIDYSTAHDSWLQPSLALLHIRAGKGVLKKTSVKNLVRDFKKAMTVSIG